MLKTVIFICIFAAYASVECGILKRIFGHETTSTTEIPSTTTRGPSIFFNNNLPKVENGCEGKYVCARKISVPQSRTKACLKYCLKHIECKNNPNLITGKADECVELNEQMVRREYEETSGLEDQQTNPAVPVMRVAMIDFPCQPGYLPDSRGRCREVW